ncbi:BioY family protein [Ruminococcus albus SY3]|uniref:Biotin transporter n=1 Tax=Ruminococcus albus SY3 TaxID=1341156 RepID=A0A011UX20_RUMAL|nr:biotin transporter BioY [Ruminococcus albus]EXM37757.1 BioY family protein [Ruminococcus albus SY3]
MITQTATSSKHENKQLLTVKDMSLTAMFAVLMAVCSWISIPTAVPFTLQTFAVFCAVSMLGGKRGFFAVLVYILLGAVGIPVFSGFKGGAGILLGATGGYILGFLVLPLVCLLTEKLISENVIVQIISMIVGLALCYAFGTAWFIKVYTDTKGDMTVANALKLCVLPFVFFDIVKLGAAVSISAAVKSRVRI